MTQHLDPEPELGWDLLGNIPAELMGKALSSMAEVVFPYCLSENQMEKVLTMVVEKGNSRVLDLGDTNLLPDSLTLKYPASEQSYYLETK